MKTSNHEITLNPTKPQPVQSRWPVFFKTALIAGLIFMTGAFSSFAATTRTWTGSGGGNTGDAGNWNPSGAPADGDTLVFDGTGINTGVLTNNSALTANGMAAIKVTSGQTAAVTFNGGSQYIRVANGGWFNVDSGAGAVTIQNSQRILFGAGVGADASFYITNNSANPVTWASTANTSLYGGQRGRSVNFYGSGNWVFNLAIPTVSAQTNYFIMNGNGSLTFAGANSYSPGGVTLNSGTLNVNNATALGGSGVTLTLAGGTIDNTTAGAITLANNNPQNWNGNFTFAGTKDLNLGTGAVTLNATPQVTVSAGTLTVGGPIGGSGFGFTKAGVGKLLLSATNTYTGPTVVSNGKLVLTASALLANSSSITVSSGATFDISSNAFTLSTGQSLLGSGTNNGSIAVASGAGVYAGLDLAYGTNTITTNLTFSSGANVYMDLGTTFNGVNDLITVGQNLTLNNTVFHIKAPSTSVNLDTTDYTLMTVGGTTTGNPALAWDVQPLNYAHYSIGKNGNNVILHYNSSLVPSGTGVASPNPIVDNQPVLITVTVTFSSNPINTVTVDASALGASSNLPLIAAGGGNYTNTVVVAPSVATGTKTLVATMTDNASLVGTTPGFTVTVNTSSEVWNGGGANDFWSSNPNWQSGFAPGYIGDDLTFAGTIRPTPDMNGNYTITTLTFDGTAGSFTLGSSGGYGLTLTGGSIANNSANTQTVNLAITNGGNLVDVSGGNNVVFNGGIAGAGGLQDDNSGVLILNGTNSFTGGININSGTLQIAGAGLLGGTNGNYAGNITNLGAFQYSSSATQTLAGVISFLGPIKDGSGRLILTANNTYTGNTVISNGVLQIAGAGGLGYGSAGVGSTVDYYIGNLLVNGTFEYSSSYGQTIVNAITGTGGVVVDGLGTLILNGANTYSGPTVVTGGTLVYSPNTFTYPTINSLSIYSNAIVTVNANNGASLPVGNLTLNSNSILNLNYNFSGGNPTVAAVAVSGSFSAPGTNIILRITGFGAAVGQFPLISYTGASPANLNNYIPSLPPGVTGNLVNNTGAKTIDLNITTSSPTTWIPLKASDGSGTNSFVNALNWNDGNPPTAGNGYYTQGFILRSPADANAYTFAGSALSIDAYTPGAGGRFLMKGPGGAVITVTNLILNGGLVDYADPVTGNETLAGMITLNGGTTSYLGAYAASSLSVTAPITGTGNLQIGGANINAGADTGFVVLSGASTYSGSTAVAGGTLLANGTAPNTSVTILTNATLGGLGSIAGPVTVQVGGKLAPGIQAQGALTNTIGTLTVSGAVSASGAVAMKINRGASPNADKLIAPSVTINSGATLIVTNLGSTNLVAGDTFTLFSTPVSGTFTAVTLPALPGTNVFWTNNLAVNGTIGVVALATVNTSPTNITSTVSGSQLILSWPADHIGWHLQVQTNSLSTGLGTNWVTIPGTDTAGSYTNSISPANGSVFYRMVYP